MGGRSGDMHADGSHAPSWPKAMPGRGKASSFAFHLFDVDEPRERKGIVKNNKLKFLMKISQVKSKGHGGGAVRAETRRFQALLACLLVGLWGFNSELTMKRTKRDCD